MAASASGVNRFYVVLGAGALVGAAALVYLVTSPRGGRVPPKLLVGAAAPVFLGPGPKAVSIPANVAVLAADTAGFRGYTLGADSKKVEVSEYADFECPACQYFESVQFPSVRQQLIAPGLVRWRYRDFPLEQHQHSRIAAHASACASDQHKYWSLAQAAAW